MLPRFCIPTMSHHFQRLVKIYYLSLDFLKGWQSVLIRKIKLLTFSFTTTTLLDVLDKSRYQHNISKSKRFSPGSDFTEQIFTGELSRVDSTGVLRQGALKIANEQVFIEILIKQ